MRDLDTPFSNEEKEKRRELLNHWKENHVSKCLRNPTRRDVKYFKCTQCNNMYDVDLEHDTDACMMARVAHAKNVSKEKK